MLHTSLKQPQIEPFEYQNRSVYRDLLRLSSSVREHYSQVQSDLSKTFLQDLFTTLFFISKEVAYLSIHEDPAMKMDLLAGCIIKTFDSITAFDVCFDARWISSVQYFEAKQILEKTYWIFKEEQKAILAVFKNNMQQSFHVTKQFQ